MTTATGIVEAMKVTPQQTAILLNGDWYSSFRGMHTKGINKGDTVSIDWSPDKTGKWKNIKAAAVTAKGVEAPTTRAATAGVYSPRAHLGVELGHASKLAMDVMLAKTTAGEVGGEAFYKEFIQHTHKIFKIMGALRTAGMEKEVPKVEGPKDAGPDPLLAADEPF